MSDYARQIIALGGGGFSMEPDEPALDLYVLEQARLPRPAICFLATATGDSSRIILNFYSSFSRYECRPTHLPFFQRTPDVRAVLLSQDVIYVGGGNTRSMLAVWREWGLPQILREAWEAGIVLAGISAGAICWFNKGLTDSMAGELSVIEGLGFLEGSCCPHYDGEIERRPIFHQFLREGRISGGLAIDDGVAVHFVGDRLQRVVASRRNARAYRMRLQADQVIEEPYPVEFIGLVDR